MSDIVKSTQSIADVNVMPTTKNIPSDNGVTPDITRLITKISTPIAEITSIGVTKVCRISRRLLIKRRGSVTINIAKNNKIPNIPTANFNGIISIVNKILNIVNKILKSVITVILPYLSFLLP
ncbi:MAG: hypothetical protein U0M12_07875 [Acutalibacteraceae bacterium]|nr:hypothetical protein [Acutalibacteraceae bacterium]